VARSRSHVLCDATSSALRRKTMVNRPCARREPCARARHETVSPLPELPSIPLCDPARTVFLCKRYHPKIHSPAFARMKRAVVARELPRGLMAVKNAKHLLLLLGLSLVLCLPLSTRAQGTPERWEDRHLRPHLVPVQLRSFKEVPCVGEHLHRPARRLCSQTFAAHRHHAQAIAGLDFVCVFIDGMGTALRSKAFQSVSYENLGAAGFEDHIAAMKQIAAGFPYMDQTRVGGGTSSSDRCLRPPHRKATRLQNEVRRRPHPVDSKRGR
jgi:hypothetical protein